MQLDSDRAALQENVLQSQRALDVLPQVGNSALEQHQFSIKLIALHEALAEKVGSSAVEELREDILTVARTPLALQKRIKEPEGDENGLQSYDIEMQKNLLALQSMGKDRLHSPFGEAGNPYPSLEASRAGSLHLPMPGRNEPEQPQP